VIRIAAVADLHLGVDSGGHLRTHLQRLPENADVLLIAGDLTRRGSTDEGEVVAGELRDLGVPVISILGNHDYHGDQQDEIRVVLEKAGVAVLEGESTIVEVGGLRLGVAGIKGFGGGFAGASGSDFGEPEMKAFIRHTQLASDRLEQALHEIEDVDVRVALLHYSPVRDTLVGERLEIYPFLGSYLLAEAIDRAGADVVFHGHAHAGTEKGVTPAGIRVRNVAQTVIKHSYNVYEIGADRPAEAPARA
jgi:Icc-related predicted phosphoesterase